MTAARLETQKALRYISMLLLKCLKYWTHYRWVHTISVEIHDTVDRGGMFEMAVCELGYKTFSILLLSTSYTQPFSVYPGTNPNLSYGSLSASGSFQKSGSQSSCALSFETSKTNVFTVCSRVGRTSRKTETETWMFVRDYLENQLDEICSS
jgi:hypothetical protein